MKFSFFLKYLLLVPFFLINFSPRVHVFSKQSSEPIYFSFNKLDHRPSSIMFKWTGNNANRCETLLRAVKEQNLNKVKDLLKQINPNCKSSKHESEVLVLRGKEYQIIGAQTPLVAAARNGNVEIAKLLIEAKAKVEYYGRDELTPLMEAAAFGNMDIAKLLIENGASVDKKLPGEGTALLVAARKGHPEVIEFLHQKGAKIESEYGDGTPLLNAVRNGHVQAVKMLVHLGAKVDGVSRGEGTPLLSAVRKRHYEIVEFLLEQGANPRSSHYGEESPAQWVQSSGDKQLQGLLSKY